MRVDGRLDILVTRRVGCSRIEVFPGSRVEIFPGSRVNVFEGRGSMFFRVEVEVLDYAGIPDGKSRYISAFPIQVFSPLIPKYPIGLALNSMEIMLMVAAGTFKKTN